MYLNFSLGFQGLQRDLNDLRLSSSPEKLALSVGRAVGGKLKEDGLLDEARALDHILLEALNEVDASQWGS